MRYLMDTDWAIHYFNGVSPVVERLNVCFTEGVGISVISLIELYKGVPGSRNPQRAMQKIGNLLAAVQPVSLDAQACAVFSREWAKLRRSGNLIDDYDLLIAVSALCRNLALLTNNRRHFERIDRLRIISVPLPESST